MSQRSSGKERVPGLCFYCGNETLLDEEHVIPLARGGVNEPWNIVRACFLCNGNKGDQIPSEWCPTHEAAMAIERQATVIFPRMRFGFLLGSHEQAYARVRSLCVNFLSSLKSEMNGLPSNDRRRAVSVHHAVDKLRIRLESVISNAEATGYNDQRKEFLQKLPRSLECFHGHDWVIDSDGKTKTCSKCGNRIGRIESDDGEKMF